MSSLFSRANAGLNLTPGERAVLRLLEGFVIAGIVAALPVVAQLLAQQSINWGDVARIAGGTFAVAFLLAVAKFYKAQGDAPLATVAADVATQIASATGLNAAKTPIVEPSTATVPSAPHAA